MRENTITSSLLIIAVIILASSSWISGQTQNTSIVEDEATIRLFYYPNPQNSSERKEINLNNSSSFQDPKLTKGKRAKILVHGANGNCNGSWFPLPSIQAYLRVKASEKEDYNVFCIDYQQVARVPYPGSNGRPPVSFQQRYEYVSDIVGNKTARLILALEAQGVVKNLADVHLIGHSLGGHVVGVTGRKVREMVYYQRKVGRITGLDVMNAFYVYSRETQLRNLIDSSDATFVDIVHANDGQIGWKGDYGQVDYYPDGGEHQKSCLQNGPIGNLPELLFGGCSHLIVGVYWANSIINPNLTSCKADSYAEFQRKIVSGSGCSGENNVTFGEYVVPSAHGKFYMDYPIIKVSSV